MSAADVATVRALVDALNAHDAGAIRALLSEDFTLTTHVGGRTVDRDAYVASHGPLDAAFPDLHREVLDARDEGGGRVRIEMRIVATNDRPVVLPELGVDLPEPTGRVLRTVPHVDTFELRRGRITTYHSEQPPGSGLRGLLDQIRPTGADA